MRTIVVEGFHSSPIGRGLEEMINNWDGKLPLFSLEKASWEPRL